MADVQVTRGGGASWAWALVVIVLLAIIAWFIFGGGLGHTSRHQVDVNVNTPGQY